MTILRMPPARHPEPLTVTVARMEVGGRMVTAITREWAPDDCDSCRLCPIGQCYATARGTCMVMVAGNVPRTRAPLFARPGSPMAQERMEAN